MNGSFSFLLRRAVAAVTACSFALQPILAPIASAQQITDPRAPIQFRPNIGTSSNGTPLVNITTPSFGGISHNQFQRYDIDTRGLILNNSGMGGTSVIGGQVTANPNLVGRRPASIILNEVTGTAASTLNGPTEVFGSRADVIVANPNGVGCVGCTFINTGKVTLTTGVPTPDYTLGTVRYNVTGGTVSVSGAGLSGGNGETLSKIDLIGRQLRIEGPIVASDAVRLRAGAVDYHQATDIGTPIAGAPSVTGLAIASTAGGTIRAGTISVVSRDINLGVELGGSLTALSGEVSIRSAGDARVGEAHAATDLTIDADGSVLLSGRKEAIGRMVINGRSVELQLSSDLAANDSIVIQAVDSLVARGLMASGQDISLTSNGTLVASGTISALGQVSFEGNSILTQDLAVGGTRISLAGLTDVILNNSGFRSSGDIAITGRDITLGDRTGFDATGRLFVDARNSLTNQTILDYANLDLTIRNSLVIGSTGAIVQDVLLLNVRDQIDNSGTLIGRQSATIATTDLSVEASGVIYGPEVTLTLGNRLTNLGRILSDRTMAITTGGLVSNNGTIQAGGALTLQSASYTNTAPAGILAGLTTRLIVSGAFESNGTVLGSQGLSLQAAALINRGTLVSGGNLALAISADASNSGTIAATDTASLVIGGNFAAPGHVYAQNGNLTLQAGGAVTTGGDIIAAGTVIIRAASYESQSTVTRLGGAAVGVAVAGAFANLGQIASTSDLLVQAGSIANGLSAPGSAQGTMSATNLQLAATANLSNQGILQAENVFALSAGGDINTSGAILALVVGATPNPAYSYSGSIVAGGNVTNSGRIQVDDTLLFRAGGSVTQMSGAAIGARVMDFRAIGVFDNAGTILATAQLVLASADLTNRGTNAVIAAGLASLTVNGSLTNEGQISAVGGLALSVTGNVTSPGHITASQGALTLNAGGLVASGGDILASGALTMTANGYQSLSSASRLGGTDVTLHLGTGDFLNLGQVGASGNLILDARAVTNASTGAIGAGTLRATASGDISNAGAIQSADNLTLAGAGAFTNSGLIASQNTLSLSSTGGGLNNASHALVQSGTDLTLDFTGQVANHGSLLGANTLSLTAGSYLATDANARLESTVLTATTSGAFSTAGRVIGQNSLTLHTASLALYGSNQVLGGDSVNLTTTGNVYNEGLVLGTNGLTLNAGGNLDNRGLMQSDHGAASLTVTGDVTLAGSLLAATNLTVNAGSLTSTSATTQIAGSNVTLALQRDLANQGLIASTNALAINGLAISARDLTNTGAGSTIAGSGTTIILTGSATNQGAIQSTSALALTAAGTLTNSGTLAAETSATLALGGALTNSGSILANDTLRIAAASLDSQAGSKLKAYDTTLVLAGGLVNSGEITAVNRLTSTSGVLTNTASGLMSAYVTDLTTNGNLVNSGALSATAGLSARVHGALINSGTLTSQGDMALTLDGAFTNQAGGQILATGTSVISAASLANATTARLEANQLGITLTGALTNNGTILASDLAAITASAVTNQGTSSNNAIISADRLAVTTTGLLDNAGYSTLQGASTAQVSAGSVNTGFLTNTDVATGRFNFSRNLDFTLTGSGYTFDSQLMVAGNLRLAAHGDIVNNALVAAGGTLALMTDNGSISNNAGATLYSVGDMALSASGDVINTSAVIQSFGNMTILAGGQFLNTRGPSILTWETMDEAWAADAAGTPRRFYVYGSRLWQNLVVYQKDSSIAGVVDAQGSLTVQADTFNNDASTVSVGGDLTVSANTFINADRIFNAGGHLWKLTGSGTGYRGFSSPCCGNGSLPDYIPGTSSSPAVITVGGNFVSNSAVSSSNTGAITANTATIQAPSVTIGITDPNVWTPVGRTPQSTIDLSNYVSVLQGNPLYRTASLTAGTTSISDPTRPQLPPSGPVTLDRPTLPPNPVNPNLTVNVDVSPHTPGTPGSRGVNVTYLYQAPLTGSTSRDPSWILSQVGDARSDLTFFADPTAERRVIQQALLDQTGRTLIDPSYRDPQTQQAELYQGTVDFLRTNPTIHLGDRLTSEQRASITAPTLWYNTRVIDGQKVLVPELILPPGDLDRYRSASGGTITADNITITGDAVHNTGILTATQDLTVVAGDFLNEQRLVPYTAGTGHGHILEQGGILSGENVTITALGSLTSVGGRISGTGDVSLTAAGNVNIVSQIVDTVSILKKGKVTTTTSTVRNIAAEVEAGDTLSITSTAGDVLLRASELMGQRIDLSAEGAVQLLAGMDTTSVATKGKKSGLIVNKLLDNGSYTEDLIYNRIFSGEGGLNVTASSVDIDYESSRTTTTTRLNKTSTVETVNSVDGNTLPAAILASLSTGDGLGWMSQLTQDPNLDVTYTGIETTTRSWNNDKTTLSPAMSALISLVAGIVVPGIGSMIGTALGIGGSLTAILGGGAIASAVSTGVTAFTTSFVSNAIIAGINGDFDLSHILTSAAVSGLTAGLTAGVTGLVSTALQPQVGDIPGSDWLGSSITPTGPPEYNLANVLSGAVRAQDLEMILTSGAIRTLINAPISAGVNSLLTGADFGRGLIASLGSNFASNVLQPGLMFEVGNIGVANGLAPGSIEMSLLHAGVGALGGAIMGGGRGALGGALGAGLSELIVSNLNVSTDTQRTLSQLIGGIGSLVAGDGSMSGATSALNGFEYNDRLHPRPRIMPSGPLGILASLIPGLANILNTGDQRPGLGDNGGPPLTDEDLGRSPDPSPPPLDPRNAGAAAAAAAMGYLLYTGRSTSDGRPIFSDGNGSFVAVDPVTTTGVDSVVQVDSNGFAYPTESFSSSIVDARRLANQLRVESAQSPFAADGSLTQSAIDNATPIARLGPGQLNNPNIPSGYGKYTSETFQSPSGDFQIHFYMNPSTGRVFYDLDYKAVFNTRSGVR